MKTISIFQFEDYRLYLTAWLKEAKVSKICNLSDLAKVAGVHPTFLSQVLLNKKDLSLEQAALISAHLIQTNLEREYLFAMIQHTRAGNPELRNYWAKKLREIVSQKNKLSERFAQHSELSTEEKAIFYSSWLYSAVRLASDIGGGRNLQELAARFQITATEAERILDFLIRSGLCVETNGIYNLANKHVHVPSDSPFVSKHHINWRTRAIVKQDARLDEDLFFTAPMTISKTDFEILREEINQLIKAVVERAKASTSENLVCLNIDFFQP